MLQQLVINDLAVIDSVDIEFKPGMTVLTGETGAGKSILLDALGLILGNRSDTGIIRVDKDETDITAIFLINENPDAISVLQAKGIQINDNELFIRRVINRHGRSKTYLNNTPIPVQSLRDIGKLLIDIHGQHAHQSLSQPDVQLKLLDQLGEYDELLTPVINTYQALKQINQQINDLQSGGGDETREAKLTLLRYQIDELSELNVRKSEYHELSEKYKRITNLQHLLDTCHKALNELSESDNSIDTILAKHQRNLSDLSKIDPALTNISQLLDDASIQTEEATTELRNYIDRFDDKPSQLAQVENRLDKLYELARKHKVRPDTLPEHLESLSTQLYKLENGQAQYDVLQSKKAELTKLYFQQAAKLREKRIAAAKKISKMITGKMHELGINGIFNIDVKTIKDETPHVFGMEKVTFMVSTNPGQPLRPVTKIASGGELSRLSLAIQIINSGNSGVPTLIFDEVDAGISGNIAEIVGKLLHRLAGYRQVLCVTHLAQIASCGHHHYRISKETKNNETFTRVHKLNQKERIDEIARMLAGMTVTEESRANAVKMLETI